MYKRHDRAGYIIVMTMLIIAAATVVVSVIFTRGSVFIPYADTMIKREQAKMLALGGVSIARAQLAQMPEEGDKSQGQAKEAGNKDGSDAEAKLLLKTILPSINRWQMFALASQNDGIDGQIAICLTSEEGKFDLNKIRAEQQDQERVAKQEGSTASTIKKEVLPLVSELFKRLEKELGAEGLLAGLEAYFKEHKEPITDVTELLRIPAFVVFRNAVVYEPPDMERGGQAQQQKRPLYLTDIFTVHGSEELEPWLFSDSIAGLLELPRAGLRDEKDRKKQVDTIIKEAKTKANWASDWNKYLKPLYGKELQSLPKNIESVLTTQFSPSIFSVISEGTVGGVTQRLLALVQREQRTGDKNQRYYDVTIKKLYWL